MTNNITYLSEKYIIPNLKLIRKYSHTFSYSKSLTDDIYSESIHLLYKNIGDFDPNKGTIGTFIFHWCRRASQIIKREESGFYTDNREKKYSIKVDNSEEKLEIIPSKDNSEDNLQTEQIRARLICLIYRLKSQFIEPLYKNLILGETSTKKLGLSGGSLRSQKNKIIKLWKTKACRNYNENIELLEQVERNQKNKEIIEKLLEEKEDETSKSL